MCRTVPGPSGSLAFGPALPPSFPTLRWAEAALEPWTAGPASARNSPGAWPGSAREAWTALGGQQHSGCSPPHVARLESCGNTGALPHPPRHYCPPQLPATKCRRILHPAPSIYFNTQLRHKPLLQEALCDPPRLIPTQPGSHGMDPQCPDLHGQGLGRSTIGSWVGADHHTSLVLGFPSCHEE